MILRTVRHGTPRAQCSSHLTSREKARKAGSIKRVLLLSNSFKEGRIQVSFLCTTRYFLNSELLPLTANPNRLLEADPDEWEEGEEGNYEYDDEYEEDEDAWGENRGADAGFDYMKLTRPIGRAGGVFVSRDGTVLPSDRAPDMDDSERQQQFRSETDMLNQRQREIAQEEGEIDPEILAALDQFDEGEYEEFDESFITELQQGGEDDQDYSSEEDLPPFDPTAAANTRGRRLDDLDYDSLDEELGGSYDPSDDELEYAGMEKRYAYEPESRESSQPAVRRVGATAEQQMTESMFDVAMQRFELDELDDPEEPVVMRGSMPAATFNHIFDEFLHGAASRYLILISFATP